MSVTLYFAASKSGLSHRFSDNNLEVQIPWLNGNHPSKQSSQPFLYFVIVGECMSLLTH